MTVMETVALWLCPGSLSMWIASEHGMRGLKLPRFPAVSRGVE